MPPSRRGPGRPRKSSRKSSRKSARKSVRKSSRKSVRKSSRKSVRKSARKVVRKSFRKSPVRRSVGRPRKYGLTPLGKKCKAAYDAKITKIMETKQSRDSVSAWDIEQRLCKLGLNNNLVKQDEIQAALEEEYLRLLRLKIAKF